MVLRPPQLQMQRPALAARQRPVQAAEQVMMPLWPQKLQMQGPALAAGRGLKSRQVRPVLLEMRIERVLFHVPQFVLASPPFQNLDAALLLLDAMAQRHEHLWMARFLEGAYDRQNRCDRQPRSTLGVRTGSSGAPTDLDEGLSAHW